MSRWCPQLWGDESNGNLSPAVQIQSVELLLSSAHLQKRWVQCALAPCSASHFSAHACCRVDACPGGAGTVRLDRGHQLPGALGSPPSSAFASWVAMVPAVSFHCG